MYNTSTGLLWAVENLLWSPGHLKSAALALARLARLDPGGQWNNRPINTLTDMLLPWYPQIGSDVDTELMIIDLIRSNEPDVAWDLMLRLLPGERTHADLVHRPDWRDWASDPVKNMSPSEQTVFLEHLTKRILADADACPPRLKQLIPRMRRLPLQQRTTLLETLQGIEIERYDETDRESIWHSIRVTLSRLRINSAVSGRLFPEEQEILKELFHHWAPTDPIVQHAWLFSTRPELPEHDGDWVNYKHVVSESRANAVSQVMNSGGILAIQSLASRSDDPWLVGFSFGLQKILETEDEGWMANLLGSDADSERKLGEGYVAGSFAARGWDWAESILESGIARWSVRQQSLFLLSLPSDPRVWDWTARLGDACDAEYWKAWSKWVERPSDCEYVIKKLNEHSRPRVAIRIAAGHVGQDGFLLSASDVMYMLECATLGEGTVDSVLPSSYEIEVIFGYIAKRDILSQHALMQLEWLWIPILTQADNYHMHLHDALSKDPQLFADMVAMLYPSVHERVCAADEQSKINAEYAYQLLSSWNVVPGSDASGVISEKLLSDWIGEALAILSRTGHSAVGAQHIGRVLRYASSDDDSIWPPAALYVIEHNNNPDIERGFEDEFINSRGITSRGLTEGGEQERKLAERYDSLAMSLSSAYPRASALFRRLASNYEQYAMYEDIDAELLEDIL
ncbi:MAG: hypothetical protein M9890_04720 [Thermomicrobiales bacterium]|nr:hypothetical protein [Thermomicrobiales bacterium]